jgi:hypothetical protein
MPMHRLSVVFFMSLTLRPAPLFLLLCSAACASGGASRAPRSFTSAYWENDTWYNADRNYTNGVKAINMSAVDPGSKPVLLPIRLLERNLPRILGRDPYWDWMSGWSLGQLMYTPRTIDVPTIQPNDRPFGGLLYVGRLFTASRPDQGDVKAMEHNFELDVGVTGQQSLADETQKWVHANIAKGAATPRGWGNQIPTEPVIGLEYGVRTRWKEYIRGNGMRAFDLIPDGGGSLGTAFTQASTGLTARLGFNLGSDFGPTRIVPVAARMSQGSTWFEAYVMGRVGGRAVLRNMFLQGGGFREAPHTVSPRLLVGDAEIAGVVRFGPVAGSFRWVRRSPEFLEADIYQSYGVLNLIVLH